MNRKAPSFGEVMAYGIEEMWCPTITKEKSMSKKEKKVQKPEEFRLTIASAPGARVKIITKGSPQQTVMVEFLEPYGIFDAGYRIQVGPGDYVPIDEYTGPVAKRHAKATELGDQCIDIHGPQIVQVTANGKKGELWVNVDGICRLRAKGIPKNKLLFEIKNIDL